jgi:hypothetical protein
MYVRLGIDSGAAGWRDGWASTTVNSSFSQSSAWACSLPGVSGTEGPHASCGKHPVTAPVALLLLPPPQVLLQDAAVAISLLDIASDVDSGSVLPPGCTVPTAFDDDPDASFAEMEDKLVAAVRSGGLPQQGLLAWNLD